MRSFLSLTAVFVFTSVVRADDSADAKAIVEKAVKAHGYKADDKSKVMMWAEKGTFAGGDFKLDYTGDWVFQAPDKLRFDIKGEFGGMKIVITVVVNGEKAWESGFGQVQDVTGDKLDYVRGQAYQLTVTSLQPLLADKEFKLATAGEKDINGKKAVGVKVTREKHEPITLYFDKTTGLLSKLDTKVKDEFQGWKEVSAEVYFDDYKEVNGRKLFGKMKIDRDGKTMLESKLSDYKTTEKLDPKLLEKP
jgi:hypothetical protein